MTERRRGTPARRPLPRRPAPSERARHAECAAVVSAANLLGLREFDFFRLAYRRWHGHQPDERALERAFVGYMLRGTVPPWVRHAAREASARSRDGTLDRNAFGAERYRERPAAAPHGKLVVAMTAAVFLVLYGAILGTESDRGLPRNHPSCGYATAAPFFETWVRTIAGKPLPRCDDAPIAGD